MTLSDLYWIGFFLMLAGYASCLESKSVRRVAVAICLALAVSVMVSAEDAIIYTPIPCEDVPWWLWITRPDCW